MRPPAIPPPGRCGAHRRGAALIIAIVVLASLLMLGLPFIFTQSSSLSGTRSFAHSQSAYINRDAAENVGVGAGTLVVKTSLKGTTGATGTEQWTSMVDKLVGLKGLPTVPAMPPGWAVALSDNRVGINMGTLPGFNGMPMSAGGAGRGQAQADLRNSGVIGTAIEDEAGKLDVNSLTVAGWDALLKQVGIDDWDDQQAANSRPVLQPNGGYWGIDDDNYGELARALAESRLNLPGRRYTRFDQLLLADTHNWSGTSGSGQYGLRRPLTRSELDLLLPYLTLHNPSQGRGSADPTAAPPPFGLGKEAIIDLGTIVGSDAPDWANGWTRVYYIDSQAANNFDHSSPLMISQSQPTLLGMGTWVITDQVDPQKGPDRGIVHMRFSKFPVLSLPNGPARGSPLPTGQTTLRIQATWNYVDYNTVLYPTAGPPGPSSFAAVAIEAPPTVNINDAPTFVRALYGFPATSVLPKPFMTQDALRQPPAQSQLVSNPFLQQQLFYQNPSPAPFTYLYAFNLQNPLASSYIPSTNVSPTIDKRLTELPPLAISSPGIFSIISSAAVLDGQGRQGAQEMRRAVVQALPQEQVSERRWITQGQFYGLVSQRYGSAVETWPNATRRLQQNPGEPLAFPDDPDLSSGGSPAALTGLKPAVQPNEATGFINRTDSVIPPDNSFTTIIPAPPVPVVGQGKPQHFLISPAFSVDWRMPLGGDVATDSNHLFIEKESGSPNFAAVVGNGSYAAADLHPDGLLLKSGAPLAMEILDDTGSGHGLLRRTAFTVQTPGGPLRGWEINGRHLGFYVTPQSDWTTGIYPLLEARTPQGQVCGAITPGGTAAGSGNNDLQNYLGLFFDAPNRLLVLVFAPPAIEHLADYGLNIPNDETMTTFDLDERSLGSDYAKGGGQLFPLAPAQVPDAVPAGTSARLATVTPLFKPNRIVHCFKVPDRTVGGASTPYFHQNQAVHIQIALANDRPGSSAIIIDGCAGRDVGRDPSANGMMTKLGDHCALPAVALATALPLANPAYAGSLNVPAITVTGVAGLTAADLFPKRGMIKIEDEYITYQSVAGNTFSNCVRGQRQNTNTGAPGAADQWPTLEAHAVGAYVCPGGYRLTIGYPVINGGQVVRHLYTGSCTTGDHVDNGFDPASAGGLPVGPGQAWHIWNRVDPKKIPPLQIDPTDPSGNTLVLFPNNTATDIPLDQANGVPFAQWPKRGVIQVQGQVLFYSSPGKGTALGSITAVNAGWTFTPMLAPPLIGPGGPQPLSAIKWNKNGPAPMVRLLSVEIVPGDGMDPTQPGLFVTPDGSGNLSLFQIMHPSGRVEWIRYSHTASSPGGGQGYYFMWWQAPGYNDAGLGYNNRGWCRTDFAGRQALNMNLGMSTLNALNDTFPAGSKILPVQVELAPAGHMLATGDTVTILPKAAMMTGGAPGTGGNIPNQVQAVIRYAAMDGYANGPGANNVLNDVHNEWFAFNDPVLPAFRNIDPIGYEFLCWPGWSGNDLTTGNNGRLDNTGLPHGYLPRIDMLAQGFVTGGPNARTFLLACDSQRGGTNGGVMAGISASIDGIVAGPLPAANAKTVGAIFSWVAAPGGAALANGLAASGGMGSTAVTTAENAFVTPMGLIMIGGEVFAFARDDNQANNGAATQAVLVGRGLLGSTPVAHNGQEFYTILPLGPVARLDQTLPQTGGFFQVYDKLPQGGQPRYVPFAARIMRLMDPSGTAGAGQAKLELIPVIGPRMESQPPGTQNGSFPWYLTAPWLRGMYNTVQQSWSGGGAGMAPIAVGWWPRYPSALPQSAAIAQHYRSRSYAWVGFPLSLADARFDPAVFGSDPVATVSVLDTQSSGLFSLEARALSTGFDWSVAPAASLSNSAMPDQDVSAAFKQRSFSNTAVNGAELRVLWRYASAPSNDFSAVSAACNSAPMIGTVRLRALAPAKVLTVESAR